MNTTPSTIGFLTAVERRVLADFHGVQARARASEEDYQGALDHQQRQQLFMDKDLDKLSISELSLTVRTFNCLTADGIHTIADLVKRTEKEVMTCPNLGRRSLGEVQEKLAEKGWSLKNA